MLFVNGVLSLLITRLIRVSNFIDLCFIQLCIGVELENEIERVKAANRKLWFYCIQIANISSLYLHLATSEMWYIGTEEGEYWNKNCLCVTVLYTIIMVQIGMSSSCRLVDCWMLNLDSMCRWIWLLPLNFMCQLKISQKIFQPSQTRCIFHFWALYVVIFNDLNSDSHENNAT